jgi:xylulokinase
VKDTYVIGVDCGTQSTKAVVFDLRGKVITTAREPLAVTGSTAGWAEQDSDEWWRSLSAVLRAVTAAVDPGLIIGISIAFQRETFVPLDQHNAPLRPAILWMDQRSTSEVADVVAALGESFHQVTGKIANTLPSIMKILWVRKNEPGVWQRTRRIADVGSLMSYRLTGQFTSPIAGADTSGLYDLQKMAWSEELLAFAGLSVKNVAAAVPPGTVVGMITARAAAETGLPEGLPVVAGGGDGQAFALGVGSLGPTEVALTLGTSVAFGVHGPAFRTSDTFRTMAGCVSGRYYYESVLVSGANTVSWFLRTFCAAELSEASRGGPTAESVLEKEIADIGPCSDGLVTIPYWRGAMTPYNDPKARGITVGWSDYHGRGHWFKSILEGVAFEIRLVLESYRQDLGITAEKIRIGSGGASSEAWNQIIADVTGKEILVSATVENTALGAAMLAAQGLGCFAAVQDTVDAMCSTSRAYRPDPGRAAVYDRYFRDVYKELYPAVRTCVNRIGGYMLRG